MTERQEAGASALPEPPADARAHSARVVGRVLEAVDAGGGWLPFDAYMELALYAPGLGYYAAGTRKFGDAGDFVTAPELSPLFGASLANAAAAAVGHMGSWVILEFGGGTGALAAAVLEALAARDCLPDEYLMVEVSPDLRQRQRERLAAVPGADRVRWLDRLPDTPLHGVVLANEVLDAMPVTRFRIAADARGERRVEVLGVVRARGAQDALDLAWRAADQAVCERVAALEALRAAPLPHGYASELAPRREAWVSTLAGRLASGAVLLIDYGTGAGEYYRDERRDGTLLCYYRHRAHDDVLRYPGLQDITAWVDFSAVAACASRQGLAVAGFTHQAGFLLGNDFAGLAERAMAQGPDDAARYQIAAACRQLLLPGGMGERFRVLALRRGEDVTVPGLQAPDLLRTL